MSEYVTSKQFEDFLKEERDHHDRQEDRVLDVEKRVLEVHNTLTVLQSSLESDIRRRLDKHSKTLYGNGEPGIDEQIRDIYKWIQEQKKKEADKSEDIKKYIFWGITFFVSQGIGILVARWLGI